MMFTWGFGIANPEERDNVKLQKNSEMQTQTRIKSPIWKNQKRRDEVCPYIRRIIAYQQ